MDDFDYIEKCQGKLISFARATFPGFEDPPHVRLISQALEEVERGDCRRLIITVPPRHSKSLLASQIFPAWYLGRNPKHKILLASNTQMLASDFGRNCRNIMQSTEYQCIFPGVGVSEDSRAKNTFKTVKGGEAFFLGISGTLIGRGFHLGLIDDAVKSAEEADSDVYVQKLHNWYREVLYTRQMPGGRIIIIMQRWRNNDLIGWLLDPNEQEKVEDWKIVNFPAIATEDSTWRKQGEALWPERYPVEELERIRVAIGSRSFAGMYQQMPSIEDGNILKRAWFNITKVNDDELVPPRIMALDTAFKAEQKNDFSAFTIAQRTRNQVVILQAAKRKLLFPQLVEWVKATSQIYGVNGILVEDAASGQSLIQTLRQTTSLPVIAIPTRRNQDKESQMHAIAPFVESGKVVIHRWGATMEDYLNELLIFPNGQFDDWPDTFRMAIKYLIQPSLSMRRLAGKGRKLDAPLIYDR